MIAAFLTSDAFVLPAPFPALLAVTMAAGLWGAGRRLGTEGSLGLAMGFIAACAAAAAIVHGIALVGIPSIWVLRAPAWLLAMLGVREIARLAAARSPQLAGNTVEKVALLAAGVCALGLLLAAMGPPTDADSLDYHLGVPLDWLRHGGAFARQDWVWERLVGLGEALNLLGLAGGTDELGAMLQLSGAAVAVIALSSVARDSHGRVLAIVMVLAVPLVAFLCTSQKPQMLLHGALAGAAAMLYLERRSRADVLLLATALGFAVASKYSFILSALPLAVVALLPRTSRGLTLAALGAAVLLLAVPVWARNFFWFGDPLSPVLERFRSHPDPTIVAAARHISDYPGGSRLERLLRIPVEIVTGFSFHDVQKRVGLGALALVPALAAPRRTLLLAAAAATGLTLLAGQLTPRFFIDPYLWVAILAVAAPPTRWRTWLLSLMTAQQAVMAGLAVAMAVMLAPGALTPALRQDIMNSKANGESAARWLDQVLPADAVIAAGDRSKYLARRPFVSMDRALLSADAEWVGRWRELLRDYPITHVVSTPYSPFPQELWGCATRIASNDFQIGIRNPFRPMPYPVDVFAIDREACR